MSTCKRRDFLKSAALGVTAASLSGARETFPDGGAALAPAKTLPFHLGLASYTLRAFDLDQVVGMTKRLGLEKIVLKSMHLPLESSDEAIRLAAAKVRAAGLDLYGCGVVPMTNRAEVEQAFHYAKTAGMRLIIGVPNPDLLEFVARQTAETGVGLAIHNHGPEDKLYPTPAHAYEKIKGLDKRIGLCIDIGHTVRAGANPAEDALRFSDRLLDVHIKDVTAASKDGTTVEIGRGVIDIPAFVRALIKIPYRGVVAFEYEKDENDPLPGLAESVGYVRGVLRALV